VLDGVIVAVRPVSVYVLLVKADVCVEKVPLTTCNIVPLGKPADVTAVRD